ncbi:recombinase family protein [Acetobacter senegalensis]|uniref:recombinase family protein n=1 Tax=Acetobacter senegalensis TaxID=446692 RepID=UPI00264C2AB1|nr:recombinase family protein [Acetobacter senegalensis]MDN7351965.1 recombinase family protein [Acetobacter senegalensis]
MSDRLQETDNRTLIGYARVSTNDQNNQSQIDQLLHFGVEPAAIFQDKASGKNMERPGWKNCWKELRGGDVLVVTAIDRLGRDLVEVVQTIKALHDKGADLKVLSMDLDTRTATGRLIFAIIAAMAQWERELIVERTINGLAAARARGKTGGRKAVLSEAQVAEAMTRIQAGEKAAQVAADYGVTRQAIYRRAKNMRKDSAND